MGKRIDLSPYKDEIIERYEGGETIPDLANKYSVSKWTIWDRLKKWDVSRRSPADYDSSGKEREFNFSTDEQKRIIARYENGERAPQIAKDYGCSEYTIQRRLKEWGIDPVVGSPGTIISPEEKMDIIKGRNRGETIASISGRYRYSAATIKNRLLSWGVEDPSYPEKIILDNKADIINLIASGKSIYNISNQFNVRHQSVRRALSDWGVITRIRDPIYSYNHNCFSENNEHSLFFAGALLADGNIYYNNGTSPNIYLASKDIDILKKLAKFIGEPNKDLKPHLDLHILNFTSRKMGDDLKRFGIVPNKTRKGKIQDGEAKRSPHFWRGFLAGDGWYFISGRGRPFIGAGGVNHSIIEDFKTFCVRTVGLSDTVSITTRKEDDVLQYRRSGKDAVKLAKVLHNSANVFMDRKHKIAQKIIGGGAV